MNGELLWKKEMKRKFGIYITSSNPNLKDAVWDCEEAVRDVLREWNIEAKIDLGEVLV